MFFGGRLKRCVYLQAPTLIGLHRSGAPHCCHCIPPYSFSPQPLSFNDSPSLGAPCGACCYLLATLVNQVVEMAWRVRLCLVWFSPLVMVERRGGGGGGGGGPPSVWNSARSIDHSGCRFHTANGTSQIFIVGDHTVPRLVKYHLKLVSL